MVATAVTLTYISPLSPDSTEICFSCMVLGTRLNIVLALINLTLMESTLPTTSSATTTLLCRLPEDSLSELKKIKIDLGKSTADDGCNHSCVWRMMATAARLTMLRIMCDMFS